MPLGTGIVEPSIFDPFASDLGYGVGFFLPVWCREVKSPLSHEEALSTDFHAIVICTDLGRQCRKSTQEISRRPRRPGFLEVSAGYIPTRPFLVDMALLGDSDLTEEHVRASYSPCLTPSGCRSEPSPVQMTRNVTSVITRACQPLFCLLRHRWWLSCAKREARRLVLASNRPVSDIRLKRAIRLAVFFHAFGVEMSAEVQYDLLQWEGEKQEKKGKMKKEKQEKKKKGNGVWGACGTPLHSNCRSLRSLLVLMLSMVLFWCSRNKRKYQRRKQKLRRSKGAYWKRSIYTQR